MRQLPIYRGTLLGSLRSVTSIQPSCWDLLNWGHKVYCVIVPHGGAFVNHIGFSRAEIYTEKALKPRANFPQKTRLWVAFALTLFAFSSILIYVWKLMETKHRGHREMCLHGKKQRIKEPDTWFLPICSLSMSFCRCASSVTASPKSSTPKTSCWLSFHSSFTLGASRFGFCFCCSVHSLTGSSAYWSANFGIPRAQS